MISSAEMAERLNQLAATDSDSLLSLARIAGLDPLKDFKLADFSNFDLRYQDLREFDLSQVTFDGARIFGAKFNDTVQAHQLNGSDRRNVGAIIQLGLGSTFQMQAMKGLLGKNFGETIGVHSTPADLRRKTGARKGKASWNNIYKDSYMAELSNKLIEYAEFAEDVEIKAILARPISVAQLALSDFTMRELDRLGVRPLKFLFLSGALKARRSHHPPSADIESWITRTQDLFAFVGGRPISHPEEIIPYGGPTSADEHSIFDVVKLLNVFNECRIIQRWPETDNSPIKNVMNSLFWTNIRDNNIEKSVIDLAKIGPFHGDRLALFVPETACGVDSDLIRSEVSNLHLIATYRPLHTEDSIRICLVSASRDSAVWGAVE
jgi:hypothetical protein